MAKNKTSFIFRIFLVLLSVDLITTFLVFKTRIGEETNMVILFLYNSFSYLGIFMWFAIVFMIFDAGKKYSQIYDFEIEYRAFCAIYCFQLLLADIGNILVLLNG